MKKILKTQGNLLMPPKIGEIVKGKIIGKGRSAVFLDLGALGTGIIYGKEFYETKEILKDFKTGENIFAKIIDLENEEGYIELSVSQAGKELTWETLKQKREGDETLKVKILGANKGGLLAEISGISGFLPVSQLSVEHYPRVEGGDSAKILRELQKFIGKELEVKIFDLDQKEKKLILSEKATETGRIKETLKNYKVGDVVEGEITAILDFGAFIKFGEENLEGLIHISELDWRIIEDPSGIVKINQKVKVKIIKISEEKVFLSLKALKKDPWKNIEKKYKKRDKISGEVTKFNPFGAFIKITPKIQGLCHISEFGSQKKMAEILEIGKKYDFEILSIEPTEHRMSLKLVK
ncbi:S1 RNA-binding domain-containing protein [Patescibacteria group bacterium]|nr:S1 RNA-binding domain-containing protein [Patescibacteria group bacterium]